MANDLASFHKFLKSKDCQVILVLCGAGLSTSSGLPTFRGSGGLWKNYNSMDLATPDAFLIDPSLVWQFYSYRRYCALEAKPNEGHFALAKLSHKVSKCLTITQNVDNLSARAGHNRQKLLELHGSLFRLKCTNFTCSHKEFNEKHPLTPALSGTEHEFANSRKRKAKELEATTEVSWESDHEPSSDFTPIKEIPDTELPICPDCKDAILRPDVVWFGEPLPLSVVDTVDEFLVRNKVDLMLVVGTSCSVWPAAGYVDRVRQQGGKLAVFNTELGTLPDGDDVHAWHFLGDAAEWLPKALAPLCDGPEQSSCQTNDAA